MPPEFVPNLGQLEDVWLADMQFRKNEKFDFGIHGAEWSLVVDDDEVELRDASSLVAVTVTVRWEPQEGAPFEEPFGMSLTVRGSFGWPPDFDEDYRRGWTEFNGLYLLWPYIRSYASMITGAAGLPPFYLPTLAVPRVKPDRSGETMEFQAALPDVSGPEAAG